MSYQPPGEVWFAKTRRCAKRSASEELKGSFQSMFNVRPLIEGNIRENMAKTPCFRKLKFSTKWEWYKIWWPWWVPSMQPHDHQLISPSLKTCKNNIALFGSFRRDECLLASWLPAATRLLKMMPVIFNPEYQEVCLHTGHTLLPLSHWNWHLGPMENHRSQVYKCTVLLSLGERWWFL